MRSFVKKPEKDSNGPRKAIRKNYGTYRMQLEMHTGKKLGRPRVRAGSPSAQTEKGAKAARLNRLLARNVGAVLSTVQLPNGTYSGSDEETLTLLMVAHFPGFKGPTEVGGWDSQRRRLLFATQWGIRGRLAHKIASPARVRWALKSFNPFKSPGPDGIYPVLLQRAGDSVIGPLVRLARASLTPGYVPKAWRGTRVILIPKAGMNGWTSPKDFRPISLNSFVLKTVE